MAIRKATTSDHRAMAEVAARAFVDDDVFGRFQFPYRLEHPEDYIAMWERKIWVGSNDYIREYLVAIDEVSGEVAAWAEWSRLGPGAAKRANPISLRLKKLYVDQLNRAYTWLWPDKSSDPAHVMAFHDATPLTAHLWTGKREESWMLDILCTDPKQQGKGHGKLLVNWGVEEAENEGICTSVIAAFEREGFYAKFGFVEVGRANIGPLAEVKGGAIMFKDLVNSN